MKIAQEAVIADSTIRYQEIQIKRDLKDQISCDSLLTIRKQEIFVRSAEALTNFNLYRDQLALNGILKKEKRKWVIIVIGAMALVLLETVILISK